MVLNCQDRRAKFESFRGPDSGNREANVEIFDGSKRRNRPTNFIIFEERETIGKKYLETDFYQDFREKICEMDMI